MNGRVQYLYIIEHSVFGYKTMEEISLLNSTLESSVDIYKIYNWKLWIETAALEIT